MVGKRRGIFPFRNFTNLLGRRAQLFQESRPRTSSGGRLPKSVFHPSSFEATVVAQNVPPQSAVGRRFRLAQGADSDAHGERKDET